MTTILNDIYNKGLMTPPKFVVDNTCLLCLGGSIAYGCSTESSDIDLVGVCIPEKKYIYSNVISSFDEVPIFHEFQQHHIFYEEKEYDIKVYSIARLFKLAMDGNPNIIDFLASDDDTVIYSDHIGSLIRGNANMFYSKKCCDRFIGFASNHIKSMQGRKASGKYPEKRKHLFEKYGYDTKDAAHCMRSLLALRDMLQKGSYSPSAHKGYVSGLRDGVYPYEHVMDSYNHLIAQIRGLEKTSTALRLEPDANFIRNVLIECLERAGITNDN